jgi:hypothetical protein
VPIGSCRGGERKREIVSRYVLRPVVHAKLLDGQEVDGCCGLVTDRYYFFEAEERASRQREVFHVGYDCAEQFLELIGQPRLPLFNPLHDDEAGRPAGRGNRDRGAEPEVDALNRELMNAIHIVFLSWRSFVPGSPLSKIMLELRQNPGRRNPSRARAVNTIIGKDKAGRTLRQMLVELRDRYPRFRPYEFPLLEATLRDANVVSNL